MPEATRGDAPTPTWRGLLADLVAARDLGSVQSAWAMDQVMGGGVSDALLAAFLVALRAKGESVGEVAGLTEAMLAHAVPLVVPAGLAADAVDVVGTGGDQFSTVNISTMAALVVAGTGTTVIKHGNRAASSRCGSADVLEALGVRLDLPPQRVAEVAVEAGITFCFARVFHPAMRHVAAVRAELRIPTVFNIIGPLTNPARPGVSAVGVADPAMAPLVAGVFARRGVRALVVRGEEGLDEVSPAGPSRLWWIGGGEIREAVLNPGDLGLPTWPLSSLTGGDATANAAVVREVLAGAGGPVRDAVLINAAAALAAASAPASGQDHRSERCGGLLEALRAGLVAATASIDSGAAQGALERWVQVTQQ